VFNNVLRLSGLQANLMGNTVVVGNSLPDEARNVITRTLRLNQTEVATARDFLLSYGAESALVTSKLTSETLEQGDENQPGSTSLTTTTTQTEVEMLGIGTTGTPYQGYAALPLRGLLVSIAPRATGINEVANEISLTGDPRKVEIATQLISQLETRRRQVAVNVKIIDVSLSNQDNFNTSFSFGVNDTFFSNDAGSAFLNFGGVNPPPNDAVRNSGGIPPFFGGSPSLQYPDRFLASLEAQVINGNAKILTDPTIIIQEGQTSSVRLITDVVETITTTVTDTDAGTSRESVDVNLLSPADGDEDENLVGLILALSVDRVDDNGFVTLQASPTVSAPVGEIDRGEQFATLVQRRSIRSGQIRVRDGQTLILAGIIQDSDRSSVTKVPILGDIPLLGALFRSTSRTNERNEVIVIITPNILDDSNDNSFGYGYTPSREARDVLEQQGNFQYPGN
jgi:type IV pilus assembly protein PilQ